MLKALSLFAANQVGSTVRRNLMAIATYALAALVALIGVIFALIGFYDWLVLSMSPAAASFVVAGALFLIAALIAAIGVMTKRRQDERAARESAAALLAAPLAARVGSGAGLGTLVLAGVVLAGIALGRKAGLD